MLSPGEISQKFFQERPNEALSPRASNDAPTSDSASPGAHKGVSSALGDLDLAPCAQPFGPRTRYASVSACFVQVAPRNLKERYAYERTRMNAERLHAVAIALKQDLAGPNIIGIFQGLVSALGNQVAQPGQPQFQQQVSSALSDLLEKQHDLSLARDQNCSRLLVSQTSESCNRGQMLGPRTCLALLPVVDRLR